MLLIYNISIQFYLLSLKIARFWNSKANLWLKGRKDLFNILELKKEPSRKTIWMHCASLGEFEQGRPLLEALKLQDPSLFIVLTFFSPSGFEVMKDFKLCDKVIYLPLDTASNASRFIEQISPDLVLWVKYEFWYHYLTELKKRKIPVLLVSGIFRSSQRFFKFYGGFWNKMLDSFLHLFLQNEESATLMAKKGRENITISGDTRFDRVISISTDPEEIDGINAFCNGQQVIIAGSTWEEDEVLLIHYNKIHPEIKLILAPHEIYPENLQSIKSKFAKSIFYSEWIRIIKTADFDFTKFNCLIIDNVGMLSRLYRYADVCYVGGGFGSEGVHNVIEPAVFFKPVLFGPEYDKFIEAIELIEAGGGDEVKNAPDLEQSLDSLLNNENKRLKWGNASGEYVKTKAGATKQIIDFIYKNRLLTS